MRTIFLNSWYAKAGDEYFKFIKKESLRTDVFCLQEIQPDLFSKLEVLLPQHTGVYLTDNKVEVLGHIYGKAVFVNKSFEMQSFGKQHIYKNVGWDMGFAQPFDLATEGKVVHFNSIHGKTRPSDKLDTPERLKQSKIIIDYFKNTKGPKIIGGDFNLMPETKSVEMFEKAGYKNLIKEFNIQETRNRLTWEFFKDDPGFVKQHFADYVFVSPEIKVISFEVPNIEVSDHLPLILDFEI